MTLLEVLVEELKAWPKGIRALTQSIADTELFGVSESEPASSFTISTLTPRVHTKNHAKRDRQCPNYHDGYNYVTKQEWEDAMKAAGKTTTENPWKRHRGGKCPVPTGTLIDVRYRNGDIRTAVKALEMGAGTNRVFWQHEKSGYDIMQYRVVEPAAQPTEPVVEAVEAARFDPMAVRDEIAAIDQWIKDQQDAIVVKRKEKAALVNQLAAEGFALLDKRPGKSADNADPVKIGDKVTFVKAASEFGNISCLTVGEVYPVVYVSDDGTKIRVKSPHGNSGATNGKMGVNYILHSRKS